MYPLNSISHPWPSSRGTEVSLCLWEVGCLQKMGGVFMTLQEARSIPIPGWLAAIAKEDVQVFPIKRKSLLWTHCSCEISAFFCNRISGWVVSDSCNHVDCQLPGSSVHGVFQARILERVAISYSRRSSQPGDRTHISSTGRWILYNWATWEAWLQPVLARSSQPDLLTDLSLSPFRLGLLNPPQLSFCLKDASEVNHKSYIRFSYLSYISTSSSLFPQTSCVKIVPLQRPRQVSMWY